MEDKSVRGEEKTGQYGLKGQESIEGRVWIVRKVSEELKEGICSPSPTKTRDRR